MAQLLVQELTIRVPEWMTPAQVYAINKIYARQCDVGVSRQEFFDQVKGHGGSCWIPVEDGTLQIARDGKIRGKAA